MEDSDDVQPCPGMKVSWDLKKDFLRVSAPQKCYTTNPVPAKWDFGAFSWSGSDADYDVPYLTVRRG